MIHEHQQFSIALPMTNPSAMAIPSVFSKFQENEFSIAWARPRSAEYPIPVTLLHPIFRQFLDNCKNYQLNSADNNLILELLLIIGKMSNFYRNEKERVSELGDILTEYGIPLITHMITTSGHDFHTDGAVLHKGHGFAFLEVKGEVGSKGAEPYAQVVLYYTHSTKGKSQKFLNFNFPSFLITVFGDIFFLPSSCYVMIY